MLRLYNASLVEQMLEKHLDGKFLVSHLGDTVLTVYMTDKYGDHRTMVAKFDYVHPKDTLWNEDICSRIQEKFNHFTVAEFFRYIDMMDRIIDRVHNDYMHTVGRMLAK